MIGELKGPGVEHGAEMQATARLDQTLRYSGSMHDDASARRFGFSRAIVPGVYLHGFMTQLVLAGWGRDWLTRGFMRSRSRRPVYDGDALAVSASAISREAAAESMAMAVRDAAGVEVALGAASLPDQRPALPDLDDFPVLPAPNPAPPMPAGGMRAGIRFGSMNDVMTAETHAQSLRDFGESWPGYAAEGIIHPGLLLRLSMRDTIASFTYPTPGLYVSSESQFFGLAHVGDRISTSGLALDAYERKGHHYVETEQVLIANGTRPVARIRRVSIYAARTEAG